MKGLIEEVAEFAVEVQQHGSPRELRRDAKRRLLDVVGNCLAARGEGPASIVRDLVASWGGTPESTGIGVESRLPAPSAALLNGTLAHSLDFDDTHIASILHPSSSIVPAALAAVEAHGRDGLSLLDAVAVGNEITVRLGLAGYDADLKNSIFFERGQHATSICGAIGAAIAVGMVLRLDVHAMAAAAGIAASMGSGLLEANRTGGSIKRMHCGWAAHSGVIAAELARRGMTAPPTVLEGRFGFFQAWCGDRADPTRVVTHLGTQWEILDAVFKPYPCNHFAHAAVDAAISLRERHLDISQVKSIRLGLPAAVVRTLGEPPELKRLPPTGYAAAFSGPYIVAVALIGGGGLGLWLDDFSDARLMEPEVRRLSALTSCYSDEWCSSLFPTQFPAVLHVEMLDGTVEIERVAASRGGFQRPLTDAELAVKFRLNAERFMSAGSVGALKEAIERIDDATSVKDIVRLAGTQ